MARGEKKSKATKLECEIQEQLLYDNREKRGTLTISLVAFRIAAIHLSSFKHTAEFDISFVVSPLTLTQ